MDNYYYYHVTFIFLNTLCSQIIDVFLGLVSFNELIK